MSDALALPPDAEAVYEWMLGRPAMPISELGSLAAGQPWAASVPSVVEALAWVGVVRTSGSGTGLVEAVASEAAVEMVLLSARCRALRSRLALDELLGDRGGGPDAVGHLDFAEVLHGDEEMIDGFERLQRSAKREIRAFDTPPYVMDPTANALELELLSRGVRYRTIYDYHGLNRHWNLQNLETSLSGGEEARAADVPMKLAISDSGLALVPLHLSDDGIESALLVHESALLAALSALFEAYWDTAIPLRAEARSDGESSFSPTVRTPTQQQTLLRLLAAGLTEPSIADELGVSERSVRRQLSDLTERLGATTRFQAGYQAVRRGWLSLDSGATR